MKRKLSVNIIKYNGDRPFANHNELVNSFIVVDIKTLSVWLETDDQRISSSDDVRMFRTFRFQINKEIRFYELIRILSKFMGSFRLLADVTICSDEIGAESALKNGGVLNRGVIVTIGENEWVDLVQTTRMEIEKLSYSI